MCLGNEMRHICEARGYGIVLCKPSRFRGQSSLGVLPVPRTRPSSIRAGDELAVPEKQKYVLCQVLRTVVWLVPGLVAGGGWATLWHMPAVQNHTMLDLEMAARDKRHLPVSPRDICDRIKNPRERSVAWIPDMRDFSACRSCRGESLCVVFIFSRVSAFFFSIYPGGQPFPGAKVRRHWHPPHLLEPSNQPD
ncbi:hypothetical protein F5Y15DRAFT_363913 [Xylariaceae sp. FL0016]|nr:hypothetical protein F5Y15DRAFT_363913 [Xylariaceae sp. FL0016]